MKPLTPRPPDWTATAPIQVGASRELAASADEVFAALADHESWPEWFVSLRKVERFGDLDEGIGSNRSVFIGKRVQIDEEFIVWEPGKAWGFTLIAASVPGLRSMNELVTIQEIGPARVTVTYLMAIDPKPWLSLLVRASKRQLRKTLDGALAALGEHIAARRTP